MAGGFEEQVKERAKELKHLVKKGMKAVGDTCKKTWHKVRHIRASTSTADLALFLASWARPFRALSSPPPTGSSWIVLQVVGKLPANLWGLGGCRVRLRYYLQGSLRWNLLGSAVETRSVGELAERHD
ncbi:hypothetical protein B296_00029234 [Ensete ventricosum]|uniref:Uncharacterized protein n=1 Tax=Ensete ventricosum TaxID=4639 RepID=A0A427AFU0_ENSVE|nr:hypothetical protein B296_00029234 [Ensete ventricosum]